jgi:serine protease AprX
MDTDGHGTMTASFVAAKRFTRNGTTYQGIAPDAKLVALRVGTGRSNIADSRIERALKWVLDYHDEYGITIVNISLGGGSSDADETNRTLSDEVAELAKRNILVVAASATMATTSWAASASPTRRRMRTCWRSAR